MTELDYSFRDAIRFEVDIFGYFHNIRKDLDEQNISFAKVETYNQNLLRWAKLNWLSPQQITYDILWVFALIDFGLFYWPFITFFFFSILVFVFSSLFGFFLIFIIQNFSFLFGLYVFDFFLLFLSDFPFVTDLDCVYFFSMVATIFFFFIFYFFFRLSLKQYYKLFPKIRSLPISYKLQDFLLNSIILSFFLVSCLLLLLFLSIFWFSVYELDGTAYYTDQKRRGHDIMSNEKY